jgi:hypothetical protein
MARIGLAEPGLSSTAGWIDVFLKKPAVLSVLDSFAYAKAIFFLLWSISSQELELLPQKKSLYAHNAIAYMDFNYWLSTSRA